MTGVFAKLNLKDQKQIVLLNAPESFEPELKSISTVEVLRTLTKAKAVQFALAFVTKQQEVDAIVPSIAKKVQGDAIVWFAYPKGSSKRYKSGINRDSGWNALGSHGFEPVRMVAIDEDWSAKRFRRIEFIKNMKRADEHKLTARGKA